MLSIDGIKLTLAIANAGISITELAGITSISRITISRYKTGRQKARPKTIGMIARALNVRVEDLM